MHNVPATENCKIVARQHSRGLDHKGGMGPTAKGTPHEHAHEHTREPISTAKTPLPPSLIDSQ